MEAEKVQLEALKIFERVYGKEHEHYALMLNNLASLFKEQVGLRHIHVR